MKLKAFFGIGLLIIDTIILIFLIGFMGLNNFKYFSIGYVISAFGSAILIGLCSKGLDPKKWELVYLKNKFKGSKALWVAGIIIVGMLICGLIGFPFYVGFFTAFMVDYYIIFYFSELLHILMILQNMVNTGISNHRWFKGK